MKINNIDMGHGARGTGQARLEKMQAEAVERMSARLSSARAARVECYENRELSASTREEFTAIYRAEIIRAFARTGRLVRLEAIFKRAKRGGRNPYTFGVRRAYLAAFREAARACTREAHRALRVNDETASMADLQDLVSWFEGEATNEETAGRVIEPGHLAGEEDRGGWHAPARAVRHARECLVTHWALSGSLRWQSALASDLSLLADCMRVARGEGSARLGEWQGDWHNSAQRRAIERMRQRIGSGDVLLTDQPERAERALNAWQGVKTITRNNQRGARGAAMADYMLVS